MEGGDCCATQLVDGDGAFNVSGLDNFIRAVKLAGCGLSYAVVAIMGPQSSGMFDSIIHKIDWLVQLSFFFGGEVLMFSALLIWV